MERKILKKLKTDYEKLEIKPSADLWDRIDTTLENKSQLPIKTSFSFHWWKYAAVILLLISVGTLIYFSDTFYTEKTDYFVKENFRKEVLKPEDKLEIIPQEKNALKETDPKIGKQTVRIKQIEVQNLQAKKEIVNPKFSEPAEDKIVFNQPENNVVKQESVENLRQPVISDTQKINYITANDLLLGRELDKSRERSETDNKKFGVIHIDKVIPKFGNVTVLGMTVYIDPK